LDRRRGGEPRSIEMEEWKVLEEERREERWRRKGVERARR
jgi:hypothetical protein